MATIPDGDDIVEFFTRLNVPDSTWVTAVGTVNAAEIAVPGSGGEVTRAVESPATLASLMGPVRGPLTVVLGPPDAPLVAGRLTRGASAGVGFTLLGAPEPARPGAAPRPSLPGGSAGRGTAAADDEEADELPVQGDRIDHFVFGLCDVMVVQGERFKIREAGGGKLREIHVGPFRVLKPVVVDGKRVFKLVKRS